MLGGRGCNTDLNRSLAFVPFFAPTGFNMADELEKFFDVDYDDDNTVFRVDNVVASITFSGMWLIGRVALLVTVLKDFSPTYFSFADESFRESFRTSLEDTTSFTYDVITQDWLPPTVEEDDVEKPEDAALHFATACKVMGRLSLYGVTVDY